MEDGVFNLFVVDPTNVETRNMVYRMKMRSEEGKVYYFHGYKIVRPNSVLDIWHDTSTLYITVRDGADESAPVLGTGILHILPERLRQADDYHEGDQRAQRRRAVARLGAVR